VNVTGDRRIMVKVANDQLTSAAPLSSTRNLTNLAQIFAPRPRPAQGKFRTRLLFAPLLRPCLRALFTTRVTRTIRLKPRLKEAREGRKLSQAALGRLLVPHALPGFRPNHVGLLELGYRDATWAEVQALATVLEVEPKWLAGDTPASSAAAEVGVGLAKAQETSTAEAVAAVAGQENAKPAASRLPASEVPPRQGGTEALYRAQLGQALAEANRQLTDRSLTPAEWRAWREHGEKIKAALRTL
jgi:transcriptional regulator with XRE-family HTH domain